jgi:hypothetical protein
MPNNINRWHLAAAAHAFTLLCMVLADWRPGYALLNLSLCATVLGLTAFLLWVGERVRDENARRVMRDIRTTKGTVDLNTCYLARRPTAGEGACG